jgi:hypothetical protein
VASPKTKGQRPKTNYHAIQPETFAMNLTKSHGRRAPFIVVPGKHFDQSAVQHFFSPSTIEEFELPLKPMRPAALTEQEYALELAICCGLQCR